MKNKKKRWGPVSALPKPPKPAAQAKAEPPKAKGGFKLGGSVFTDQKLGPFKIVAVTEAADGVTRFRLQNDAGFSMETTENFLREKE